MKTYMVVDAAAYPV